MKVLEHGNRDDNRIENLQLSVRNSEHIKKYHSKSRNSNGQFICKNPIFNEIKFRLFDKDRKITLIFTLQKLISTAFRRSKFEFRGRFTGLKDKNGVEIYEGDIVYVASEDENAEIVWGSKACKFILEFESDWISDFDSFYGKDLEVRRTIYDN